MSNFFHEALEVADLDTLQKLTADSNPPRIDNGVYYVRAIGNTDGGGKWAQYRATSTATLSDEVLPVLDSLGDPQLSEGRWHLFTGIGVAEHIELANESCHGPAVKSFTGDPSLFVPPAAGFIYVASDTNLVYRSIGTSAGDLVQIGGGTSSTIPRGDQTAPFYFGGPPSLGTNEARIYMQVTPATYGDPSVYRLWLGVDSTGTLGDNGWIYLDGFVI